MDTSDYEQSIEISIHALREEGDPISSLSHADYYVFLSTPSARRATLSVRQKQQPQVISIHALREEGDRTLSPG